MNFKICNKYFFDKLNYDERTLFDKLVGLFLNYIFNFFILIKYTFKKTKEYPTVGVKLHLLHSKDQFDNLENQEKNFFSKKFSLPKIDNSNFLNKLNNKTNYNYNKKIVSFHFRDGLYREDRFRRPYRNSSIKFSIKAINYLLEKNYFVIRTGNIANERFPIKHDNFLDYPFSDIISDKSDLFIIKNSSFFIGTQSGLTEVAWLFDIPALQLNMNKIFEGFPKKKTDRGIFRDFYSLEFNKHLSLIDFINLEPAYHYSLMHNTNYDKKIKYIENNELQILDAVKEFENLYSLGLLEEHSPKQIKLNHLLSIKLKEIYIFNSKNYKNINKKKINYFEEMFKNLRYKIFLNGTICNSYLNKNVKI